MQNVENPIWKQTEAYTDFNASGRRAMWWGCPLLFGVGYQRAALPSPTYWWSSSFYRPSGHSVYPYINFPKESLFLLGMATITTSEDPKLRVLNGSEFWFCHFMAWWCSHIYLTALSLSFQIYKKKKIMWRLKSWFLPRHSIKCKTLYTQFYKHETIHFSCPLLNVDKKHLREQ